MATAKYFKFAGILSAALSQHHLSGFGIAQLEFYNLHVSGSSLYLNFFFNSVLSLAAVGLSCSMQDLFSMSSFVDACRLSSCGA